LKLVLPFAELHKEGIKQTGSHPNMRIKSLDSKCLKHEKGCCEVFQTQETARKLI
jgi:hypothetical protein